MTEAGGSISLPDAKKWNRGGLDTIALTWPRQGGTKLLGAIARHEASVPFARGRLVLERPGSGLRLMAWEEYGVVKAECRLGALLDGTAASFRLASREELLRADSAMRCQIVDLIGAAPEGDAAGVSRFDLTTEREFECGADGQVVLKAMRALCPTGYVVESVRQADDVVRQVAVKTGRGHVTVFRAYDKGIESGSHGPGERIRFEAQNRARSGARRSPGELAVADLRHHFGRTIEPFLKGDPVTVTDRAGVTDALVQRVSAGELSMARAERLIGSAELLRRFGRAIYADDRKSWRRLDALRRAGVAVDDELPSGSVVPVSELLRQAVDEFSA